MNNAVVGTIAFTAGVIAGFVLSNYISVEKGGKPVEKHYADTMVPKKEEKEQKPEETKSPVHKKEEYQKYLEQIKDYSYSESTEVADYMSPSEDDDEEEVAEMIEAGIEASEKRKKNKDKIVPVSKEEWDEDDDFERKDLYYFVSDNVLTDEDGKIISEEAYIGKKPRQFGWMSNDEEKIYIRNYPQETVYQVWKEKCSSIDWWGKE